MHEICLIIIHDPGMRPGPESNGRPLNQWMSAVPLSSSTKVQLMPYGCRFPQSVKVSQRAMSHLQEETRLDKNVSYRGFYLQIDDRWIKMAKRSK